MQRILTMFFPFLTPDFGESREIKASLIKMLAKVDVKFNKELFADKHLNALKGS